jgi:hypothetical protein
MLLISSVLLVLADPVVIAAGAGVTTGPVALTSSDARGPAVAASKSGAVVAWLEAPTKAKPCVRAQRLSNDGTVIGKPVELGCGNFTATPHVAIGGAAPLIVWGDAGAVIGATLTASGAAKPAFRIASGIRTSLLDVGWDGTSYWVAWSDQNVLRLHKITRAGAPDGKPIIPELGEPAQLNTVKLACTPPRCQYLYENFIGNSTSRYYAYAIDHGALGGRSSLGTSGALYSPLAWQLALPVFASHPFFGTTRSSGNDLIVGVETTAGSLIAWGRRDARAIDYEWVAADPTHARHEPIAVADEIDPQVAAFDDTHFVLVSSTVGPNPHVVARRIVIDPAYFASLPAERPAIATGTVTAADGSPAAGAHVHYAIAFASGSTMTSTGVLAQRDGSFQIPHPYPRDHGAGQNVVGIEVWSEREGEVSPTQRAGQGAMLALRLAPPAQLGGTIQGARGSRVELHVEVLSPDSTVRSRSVVWSKDLAVTTDRFDVGDLPSGNVEVLARSQTGKLAFATLVAAAGKRATVTLALGRPGDLELEVTGRDGPVDAFAVVAGVPFEIVEEALRAHPSYYRELAPGPHLVVIQLDSWEMTRLHTVSPGARARLSVRFEADLRPGQLGVAMADSPRGVVVRQVAPGSPAEVAGVADGQIIDQIDGAHPTDVADAMRMLAGAPGTKTTLALGGGRSIVVTRSRGTGAYAPGGAAELSASAIAR